MERPEFISYRYDVEIIIEICALSAMYLPLCGLRMEYFHGLPFFFGHNHYEGNISFMFHMQFFVCITVDYDLLAVLYIIATALLECLRL